MKILFILLLISISSCGKKNKEAFYNVDPSSIGLDSDGDGQLDWDEIENNSNPKLANIDTELVDPLKTVVFIDNLNNEKEIVTIKTRSLRESLLHKYHQPDTTLPILNEMKLDFDHLKDFWQLKSDNSKRSKARLTIELNKEIIIEDVQSNIGESGLILKPQISDSRIKEISSKTYRLVISTPKEELIYHLTPDVNPLDFVSSRFSLTYDQENRIIGINKDIQSLPHPIKDDYSPDQHFWLNVGGSLDLNFKPKIGQTYALIYSSLGEIQNHAISGFFSQNLSNQIFSPKKPTVIKSVIKVPKVKKLIWEDKRNDIYWDEGTGDRARDRHCFFWQRDSRGYQDYTVLSGDELKSILVTKGAIFKKSTLLHSHADYTVFLIELETNATEFNFGVVSEKSAPIIAVGIYKTECGPRKKLNYQEYPIWNELNLQYHWLSN